MEIEVIKRDVRKETFSEGWARDFVYQHRNIFSKSTRKYCVSSYPVVIKEISVAPSGEKSVWYWCFCEDCYIIVKNPKSEKEALQFLNANIEYTQDGLRWKGADNER